MHSDLHGNQIQTITRGTFDGLESLTCLYVPQSDASFQD